MNEKFEYDKLLKDGISNDKSYTPPLPRKVICQKRDLPPIKEQDLVPQKIMEEGDLPEDNMIDASGALADDTENPPGIALTPKQEPHNGEMRMYVPSFFNADTYRRLVSMKVLDFEHLKMIDQ
jgi:hypothetical protein